MKKQHIITGAAAVATAAALGLGGAALAQAGQAAPTGIHADASPTAAPGSGDSQGSGNGDRKRGPGQLKERLKDFAAEHGLTGETAVKVTQAAVEKEPTAYLLRVGKAEDGTYRARMMRPDGTMIVLTIDANFAVTSVENAPVKAPPGLHKPGKGDKSTSGSTASPTTTS